MSTTTAEKRYTPADLLAMPDGDRYELVDGELVERFMGNESSLIGGRLFRWIGNFVDAKNLGWVLPADAGYRCFPDDPQRVRRPDVSFIRRGRLPGERPARSYDVIAPDLVVEVVSPNEPYKTIEAKVEDYLKAGVRLVWVINPDTRTATIYRADGSVSRLHEPDELDGEDVLPGFRLRLGDVLLPPAEGSR